MSAATCAARLGERIRDELDLRSSVELRTALADSNASTARELHLISGSAPTSSVSIARAIGVTIDVLGLWDTPVVLRSGVARGHSANTRAWDAG